MCGIAGILHYGRQSDSADRAGHMANAIRHRGPDGGGVWSDADIALGFRRLAIVDLKTGQQPMPNEDGTIQVVFNGEIYNHRELRSELEAAGHRFATDHSDTEVLVHGYEQWGEKLLPRLNGMFGFALWDQNRKRLLIGRDRLGIKPVYLAYARNGALLFASEARALFASGLISAEPDPTNVLAYFLQQSLWGERTMFRNVTLLEAGCLLVNESGTSKVQRYWDFAFARRHMAKSDAAYALRTAIESVMARQMAADVPVLTYLSGGIDSTAITAAAQQIDAKVRAYSCIFDLEGVRDDRGVDERAFSRAAATFLGIERVELELPQDSLTRSLHATISALEEPRMGMAYVNYLIAKRVAADGKVVLSGCGGDELFGGYVSRYAHLREPVHPTAIMSRLRRRLSSANSLSIANRPSPEVTRGRILELYGFPIRHDAINEAFTPDFSRFAGNYDTFAEIDRILAACPSDDDWDLLLYLDAKTYLSGLLMVEDKLSMAHGLETRVPLIDNDLIDLAATFHWDLMCDGTVGKKVFRDAIRNWVPAVIADKPKMGFGPPDASWYRSKLKAYVQSKLASSRITARGVLNPAFVARVVDEHMSGRVNHLPLLWSLLSFDAWCEIHGFFGGDLGSAST